VEDGETQGLVPGDSPEWVDCLPVEGCVAADCAALAVGSSLLGPLLAPLSGLSVPLATLFASCTVPPGVTGIAARVVTGLGLGEYNDCAVEYAWIDRRSIGDTHMSSSDIRPRDSTRPGVLWHLPMATANFRGCYDPFTSPIFGNLDTMDTYKCICVGM